MDKVDTSETLHVTARRGVAFGTAAIGLSGAVLMSGFLLMILSGVPERMNAYTTEDWLALAGTVLIMLGTSYLLAAATVRRGIAGVSPDRPIVTLSPEGFLDRRILSTAVPWTWVRYVERQLNNRSFVALVLTDHGATTLLGNGLRRRWHHVLTFSRKPVLLCDPLPLAVKFDRLLSITQAYAAAHGGRRMDENS
jgi:hypothetical protein